MTEKFSIVGLLYSSIIGPENLQHNSNQSDAKLKVTECWSPAFSRAVDSQLIFTLSFHWLLVIFSSVLIGPFITLFELDDALSNC